MNQTPCECGHAVVWLADGSKSCTGTLNRYEAMYGQLPARWLPFTYAPPQPSTPDTADASNP